MSNRRLSLARESLRTLVALSLALLTATGCRNDAGPIRIGTAGPYLSVTGADNLRGVQMAVAEANEQGGIRGRQLELVVGNDSASGEKAVRIADGFIKDPTIVAVVGHMTSAAMIAAVPLYDGQLAAVSTMATSPQLTNISPWVFRVTASDSTLAVDLARFVASKRWSRVAILYENDSWGRRLSNAFQAEQRKVGGGETISAEPIFTRIAKPDTLDFSVFFRTFTASAPDVLMIVATNNSVGLALLKDAAALNFKTPIIGSDGLSPQRLSREPVAEGVYFPSTFLVDESDSVAMDFRVRFKKRFGDEPDMYSALGYDAALAVITAIRIAGTDRDRIRATLESPAFHGVRGATGNISFANGDRKERFGGLVRIEQGKVKTYLQWKNVTTPRTSRETSQLPRARIR
jgi:branched-chain amino acid transport system substrate-binding protein